MFSIFSIFLSIIIELGGPEKQAAIQRNTGYIPVWGSESYHGYDSSPRAKVTIFFSSSSKLSRLKSVKNVA